MEDLVIKNGRVVTPRGVIEGGLSASEGRITAVGPDSSLPPARRGFDAGGNYVLPGLIDPHVHIGLGAQRGHGEEKFLSDFATESVTAVLGGITTISTPALFGRTRDSLLPCLTRAREIGEARSLVDFKLSPYLLTEAHAAEIPRMMAEGICSFKFLMGYRGEEGRRLGISGIDWGFVYRAFETIARQGHPAIARVHAEAAEITEVLQARLKAEGREDLPAWTESRPAICEAIDMFTAGLIAHETGAPLYIVHVSSRQALDALRYLRGRAVQIYGETCPYYLVLTKDDDLGLLGNVTPPLRDQAESDAVWEGLSDGTLDTIASDHAAYQRWQKEQGGLWGNLPGMPSMGATLALLASEGVHRGRLTIEELVRLTSENAARIFGLYPQKGALAAGSDADIVILDLDREWTLDHESLKSAADYSPFQGRKVRGKAIRTFVRGTLVAEEGRIVAEAPLGRFVRPAA